jgi:hypothetical protein
VTIFDCLNDILFTKRGKLLQNVDEESNFNQYMINRWCSMYNPNMAILVNNTVNWLYSAFETKQQYYKFVLNVFPRLQNKRIHYIKKKKPDEKSTEPDNIKLLAKRLELSEREIKSYYEYSSKYSTSSACSSQSK